MVIWVVGFWAYNLQLCKFYQIILIRFLHEKKNGSKIIKMTLPPRLNRINTLSILN